MKHCRMTAGSLAAVLSAFAGIAASLAGALPAWGEDVPLTERVISFTTDLASSVFAADLDGDGNVDILSASRANGIAWYENDGSSAPSFTKRVVSTNLSNAQCVFAANLDDDDDLDVLSASSGDNKIAWYENDGGSPPTFFERPISTTAQNAFSVFATDLNGDGDVDVLSASFSDNKIAWYETNGLSPPSFTEREISTTAFGAASVFAADVNGDGDVDVLSASFNSNTIAWYENSGGLSPTFAERVIWSAAQGAISVFAADLDGDGDVDVLSASLADNTIAWYENDGDLSPTFTEHEISTAANGARSVFATDLDGDGDIDVLSASKVDFGNDDKIAWYENDGGMPPTFTERVISTTALGALSVFATDLDDDGDVDVLSASLNDNKISWYENIKPCGFDSDCDDDVDLHDFARFQAAFSSP